MQIGIPPIRPIATQNIVSPAGALATTYGGME